MNFIKKAALSFGLILVQLFSFGQYRVTFIVSNLPPYHSAADKIFLVGNFNNWNPGGEKMQLQTKNDKQAITIELPKGMYEYKFALGSWDKVEAAEGGFPTQNRRLELIGDTTVNISILHWAHHFSKKERVSTASKNVSIIDTSFYMPQLSRNRKIWIYLPAGYHTSTKKYPVLYMHDGQNVFDAATSGFGEWGVDEALDSLGAKNREMIVVAIENGGVKRINEYSPYDMEKYGKGEGSQYVDFLVKTLKPSIDKRYRTLKNEKNTFIAGSSMGGLISFYAILKYPKVFGGAGVFSPAFWITPQLKNINAAEAKKVKGKIYFFAGRYESETMVPDMLNVFEQMRKHSKAKMKTVIKAEGKHNEATWREEFLDFYKWVVN